MAKLEGLLDNRSKNVAARDARHRFAVLIKANNFDLPGLACSANGGQDCGSIITVNADHARQVGMVRERILCIFQGHGALGAILERV